MKRIAVAIVHGIDIYDPDFAATPARLLREEFARALGRDAPDPEDALVVEAIHWAPDLEERQRLLFERMYVEESKEVSEAYFDRYISRVIRALNAGRISAMGPLLASLVRPKVAEMRSLHYPTARWIMLHFVGDAIAYQGRDSYRDIHATFARGLAALARRAGADAPLCVLAHSFGTTLASDYIYDRQQIGRGRADLELEEVVHAMGPSPLARGETLAWLYTMGSPMALWALRFDKADLSHPIDFPVPELADRHPGLDAEWVNIYEKDDVVAYPLRPLSDEYAATVTEDRAVTVKRWRPLSMTPLIHPFYWADRRVLAPIARKLAEGWRTLNG